MKINDGIITLSKSELRKIYNKSSEDNKTLLKDIFGEELFKFDYHDIKTYSDACHKLGMKEHLLTGSMGGDREAQRQAQAFYKLLIIQKAMNNGVWRDEDGWSYYPYWVLYSKEEMERMSEEEKQRKGIKQLLSCADAGGAECSYISAPITGYDIEKRKRYFQQVANQLEEHGFTPVNPMRNGLSVTASHATHMRADLHLLLTCRYIVQALDSASSKGCDIEEQVADACGIQNIGCIFTDGTLKLNTQGKKIRNWAKWQQINNEKKENENGKKN